MAQSRYLFGGEGVAALCHYDFTKNNLILIENQSQSKKVIDLFSKPERLLSKHCCFHSYIHFYLRYGGRTLFKWSLKAWSMSLENVLVWSCQTKKDKILSCVRPEQKLCKLTLWGSGTASSRPVWRITSNAVFNDAIFSRFASGLLFSLRHFCHCPIMVLKLCRNNIH